MLLDRTRPKECQGFGDYLCDLGKKNGFADVKKFKQFLVNSSKKRYYVCSSYSRLVRIVSGLFIELGLDQAAGSDCAKPQCFRCLNMQPNSWTWDAPDEVRCRQLISYRDLFKPPRDKFRGNREEFCGLMMCSVKRLGLNFSPRKEGLYYADQYSKVEREEEIISRIFPAYKAFTLI